MTKNINQYGGYDKDSINIIETARVLYKDQIKLCDDFTSINGELRLEDFWNMVFELEEPQLTKCEVCGMPGNLKQSYFKSWWTSEIKQVMTCKKCFWGKKWLGTTKKEENK